MIRRIRRAELTLAELWMCGVAANPAATPEVMLRLLDPAARAAWAVLCEERDLPETVVEAIFRHPDPSPRRSFAVNPFADPALRGRLHDDPDDGVRMRLVCGPLPRIRSAGPLPDEVVAKIMVGDGTRLLNRDEMLQELISSRQIRDGFWHVALTHAEPRIRVWATHRWAMLSSEQRDALLNDPDADVQEAARQCNRYEDPEAMEAELPERSCHARTDLLTNRRMTRAVVEQCLSTGRDLMCLAYNPHTPADAVARLARVPDPWIRRRVLKRPDLDPALTAELADDPDPDVALRARMRQLGRDQRQRAIIGWVIDQGANLIGHIDRTDPLDPDWVAECAVSDLWVLRRIAATSADLPAEHVARLAEDSDPEVRHLLALNHDDAPAELLLAAFIACPHQREYLLSVPRMPRTGLAHLADHDDPGVRALAAADPDGGAAVEMALDDPDPQVRWAAAANPGLGAKRWAELLEDPRSAEAAATSARMSEDDLHTLLDRAGVPRR